MVVMVQGAKEPTSRRGDGRQWSKYMKFKFKGKLQHHFLKIPGIQTTMLAALLLLAAAITRLLLAVPEHLELKIRVPGWQPVALLEQNNKANKYERTLD